MGRCSNFLNLNSLLVWIRNFIFIYEKIHLLLFIILLLYYFRINLNLSSRILILIFISKRIIFISITPWEGLCRLNLLIELLILGFYFFLKFITLLNIKSRYFEWLNNLKGFWISTRVFKLVLSLSHLYTWIFCRVSKIVLINWRTLWSIS